MAKYRMTYLALGLALLAAASCSQQEPGRATDNSEKRVEFLASLPQISSRATEVTKESITRFQVSSFTAGTSVTPYFLDKTYSKNAESGIFFSHDPECVWPNNNDRIRFVAFAPSCAEMRTNGGFTDDDFILDSPHPGLAMDADYKLSRMKIASDIAAQVDFVTAISYGNLLVNEDTPVDLNFRHQLSRIQLKAWGASPSFDIEIAGVRLGGVGTEGVFSFIPQDDADDSSQSGHWTSVTPGYVEYIFRAGDKLVVIDKSQGSPSTSAAAVSIMGAKVAGTDYENSAMLIPSQYSAWDYKADAPNGDSHDTGMYLSVLMRITDTTHYTPSDPLIYPYADNNEGMEVIWLAVDGSDGTSVKARLYSSDGSAFFTDPEFTAPYDPEADGALVKAFGWAALPHAADWQPGYVYTYTLNYTGGVGLRDPRDPKPGKPIIGDRVLIDVEMATWQPGTNSDVTVPRR